MRKSLISNLRGASDFFAPHHHFSFLISNFTFKSGFHPQSMGATPRANPEPYPKEPS
jgi:hypothetical protein